MESLSALTELSCPDCKGAGYQLVNVKIAFTQNTESHSHGCCRVGDSSFHQQLFDPLVELFERDCAFDPLGINEEGRRRIDLQRLVGADRFRGPADTMCLYSCVFRCWFVVLCWPQSGEGGPTMLVQFHQQARLPPLHISVNHLIHAAHH